MREAQARQLAFDSRAVSWDCADLAKRMGKPLDSVQLLATDAQSVVALYDEGGALLAVLLDPGGSVQPSLLGSQLAALVLKCPLHVGALQLDPELRQSARHYLCGWPGWPDVGGTHRGPQRHRAPHARLPLNDDAYLVRQVAQRRCGRWVLAGGPLAAEAGEALARAARLRYADVRWAGPGSPPGRQQALCSLMQQGGEQLRVLHASAGCLCGLLPQLQRLQRLKCLSAAAGGAPLAELAAVAAGLPCLEHLDASGASGPIAGSIDQACALAARLTSLRLLDADGLTSAEAAVLLDAGTELRSLALSGRTLAAEGFHHRPPSPAARPLHLIHLEVGWGTGGQWLSHALATSPHLASLAIHLGAEASDSHLEAAAKRCRHLRRLYAIACGASDLGLAALLTSCTQLASLEVRHCRGPVTDALAAGARDRAPAFRLARLALTWNGGGRRLTDAGLAHLLRPSFARLRSLVLEGLPALSDAALDAIALHQAGSLECLKLDSCGSLELVQKKCSCDAAPRAGLPPPIAAAAVQRAVEACAGLVALSVARTAHDGEGS